jgi:chromosome segregation ATPase
MKPARSAIALLAFAAVALLSWSLWLKKDNVSLLGEASARSASLKTLEARAMAAENDNAALRRRLQDEGIEAPVAVGAPASSSRAAESARAETVRAMADLQRRFDALQSQFQSLQAAKSELDSTLETIRSDRRRLSTSESELKDALAASRRVVEAVEGELKTRTDRLSSLESELRRVRDSNAADSRRASQIGAILNSFEDLNRRRENTLTSLQRRFRDLTDAYRALALRLDTQRDSQTPMQITSAEVSRITSAVQSAEDELRQLSTLSAESQRLTQRLRN